MTKLIVIVGPNASGKSELAVRLAQDFRGEIVSADSRQVYRGLDIGSGKITQEETMGVPHHLLDVSSPKRTFTVVRYQKLARKAIRGIQRRGKLPILVGGSPFYIYSVVDGIVFPAIKPNFRLRADLEKLPADQLLAKLKKLDPQRANILRQSSGQHKNKRRIIRALEIVLATGKPVPQLGLGENRFSPILLIGIKRSPEELKKRIHKRLLDRVNHGIVHEVRRLQKSGVSLKRLEEFGLEYRFVAQYLQGKIPRQEMIASIQKGSERFARRQMAWFKKDPRIQWISSYAEAKRLVGVNRQED